MDFFFIWMLNKVIGGYWIPQHGWHEEGKKHFPPKTETQFWDWLSSAKHGDLVKCTVETRCLHRAPMELITLLAGQVPYWGKLSLQRPESYPVSSGDPAHGWAGALCVRVCLIPVETCRPLKILPVGRRVSSLCTTEILTVASDSLSALRVLASFKAHLGVLTHQTLSDPLE